MATYYTKQMMFTEKEIAVIRTALSTYRDKTGEIADKWASDNDRPIEDYFHAVDLWSIANGLYFFFQKSTFKEVEYDSDIE